LLDENLSPRVSLTIQRHYPVIDVLRVGDSGAPLLSILDPDLLLWLDAHERTLVTDNRKSMPGHMADHLAAGHHYWGIFQVRKDAPLRLLADTLFVYWDVTEADAWVDLVEWLPL
jgi:hypothetical protein